MPNDRLREKDRRYLKFKLKRIKRARKRGNRGEARRHANELLQYFGFGESETPIIDLFIESDLPMPFRAKIRKFRG